MPDDIHTLDLFQKRQDPVGGGSHRSIFHHIISVENLLLPWQEFLKGKRGRKDVQEFQFRLMDNILDLRHSLQIKTYTHGGYEAFNISDPKPRNIHKASVRDRLLHHAVYRALYPYFDKRFIHDSYSCRLNKGTHKAIERFRSFGYKVSKNNTKTCWMLKCDIKKFFASIDHQILLNILTKHIDDTDTLWLLKQVISSFEIKEGKGLPLGNLTSQLLVNIYMNEFDQFVKRKLKVKYYIRYADDFVIFSRDKNELNRNLSYIVSYLETELKLKLHPDKVFIKTLASGLDFLGWVHFPHHRILRTATKRRMLKKLKVNQSIKAKATYLGMLKHGDTHKITEMIG